MRYLSVYLLLIALLAVAVAGCEKENKVPYFTNVYADQTCGVAPLVVEFKATASGGDPFEQPTGGNNWLEISWNFGDGNTASGSVAYNTFTEPGIYDVVVEAKDVDGDLSDPNGSVTIEVRTDTLLIDAWAHIDSIPVSTVNTCENVSFNVIADACGFDTETGDYFRFLYWWFMDDDSSTVHLGRSPVHAYEITDTGPKAVVLRLVDPGRSTTRLDTVNLEVIVSEADLQVTKVVDNATPNEGDTVNYTVTLQNNGPDDADTIQVTDSWPSWITFVSANPSVGTYDSETHIWVVGALANGNSATLGLTGTIDTGASGRLVTNRASISRTNSCDNAPGNNSGSINLTVQ